MTDRAFIEHFVRVVDESAGRLLALSDAAASTPRAPGKWSPKEIVGHLIDSAVNNHARFVRAQLQDDLVFDGYDQDAWVRVQRYGEQPWPDLVRAWRRANQRIAAIMATASREELSRRRARHNLQTIAFVAPPSPADATLGYFMRDYVAHLEHHLRQILS
jgi:DinB family protein